MAGYVTRGGQGGSGGIKAWVIWGVAALFYLYEFFIRAAPAVMEPELQETFGVSAGVLGGLLGVYYYIYAPMQLAVGPIFDRIGVKPVLIPAALICALGCFLEVLGHAPFLLAVARFCQGFGSAFAFVGTMFLATKWFPPHQLALLAGWTTSLGMLGAIGANAGIAEVVETLGWKVTLHFAGWSGIVVAGLMFIFIPKEKREAAIPISEQAPEPVGPGFLEGLRLVLTNPQVWLTGVVATALYIPQSVIGALWGVEYISAVTGEGKLAASGAVSMIYVGWLVGGPFVGWLSDRIGHRRLLLFGSAALTVLTTSTLMFFSHIELWQVYGVMLLIGLSSCAQIVSFVVAVEHCPSNLSGSAIAVVNMMVMLFGGFAMALFGMILDWASGPTGGGDSGVYPATAYKTAMGLLPAIAVFGVVASWILRESIHNKDARPPLASD